jgi:hypothetical protein
VRERESEYGHTLPRRRAAEVVVEEEAEEEEERKTEVSVAVLKVYRC